MIKTCSDERMTYMKKLVMLVTVVLTVAMAAVCFAAGDGNDLNKQQKIVDKFVAALTVLRTTVVMQVLQRVLAPN